MLVGKEAEQRKNHHILNPLVTFEVVPKSTQTKDKTEKLEGYQSIESLQTCILISQDEYWVTVYERINANTWQAQILKSPEDTLVLNTLNLHMPLREVYEEVAFDA